MGFNSGFKGLIFQYSIMKCANRCKSLRYNLQATTFFFARHCSVYTIDGADWYCGNALDLYSVAVYPDRSSVFFSLIPSQTNNRIVALLVHDSFTPNPFGLVIRRSSCLLTL